MAARLVTSRSGRTSRLGDPRPNPQGAGTDRPYLLLPRGRLPCGDAIPEVWSEPAASAVYRAVRVYPTARNLTIKAVTTGADGAGPWECTAGVTPAPTRTRDRCAEERTGPSRLCPRDGVAVPTGLPKCPACACGQKTT